MKKSDYHQQTPLSILVKFALFCLEAIQEEISCLLLNFVSFFKHPQAMNTDVQSYLENLYNFFLFNVVVIICSQESIKILELLCFKMESSRNFIGLLQLFQYIVMIDSQLLLQNRKLSSKSSVYMKQKLLTWLRTESWVFFCSMIANSYFSVCFFSIISSVLLLCKSMTVCFSSFIFLDITSFESGHFEITTV